MDTLTSSNDLKIGLKFDDGDTRLISIPEPDSSNLTGTIIKNAFQTAITNHIFIGDKNGSPISGLYTAYVEETTRLKLDI